ncbi:transposase [Pedobacter helvus]|uniref:Transposase n=1 Tax=Pedobacter helvus TaxID=2563444 RepID=A0ABW9JE50_9SPHI|nr:transposase [Pedobacter ureilyticus]
MAEKFQNKYRIPSARAAWWDYGLNATYFITICTKDRKHYFGKVVSGEMILSPFGKFAQQCWNEIPLHFPFVILDEFVVMPNHIHGIIIIDKMDDDTLGVKTQNFASPDGMKSKETQDFVSLPDGANNKFGPQSQNLASIIRGFKIGVTKLVRTQNPNFAWQPRYHDHIIRDQKAYENISNYIRNNPSNWEKDKFNL